MRIIHTRRRLVCAAAALAGAMFAAAAQAQSPLPDPGDTTRLRHRHGPWQSGIVVSASAASVRLIRGSGDTVAYALGPSDQWEVSRGSDNHPIRGLLLGAGIGAVTGGVGLRAVAVDGGFSYGPEDVLIGAGVGAAIGAGVGALIGALSRTPRWERVLRPGGDAAVGLRLDF